MKRYLKVLLALAFVMTMVLINPPFGNMGRPHGSRIPGTGQPPIILLGK